MYGMKVQAISDIHIEFSDRHYHLPKTDADVIVLAGDIAVGFSDSYDFVKYTQHQQDKPVIFVPGNHEFYGGNIIDITKQWEDVNEEGIHYLGEGHHSVIDDTLFVGATFWTDFGEDNDVAWYANSRMNDFRIIKGAFDAFESIEYHNRQKAWVKTIRKDFKSEKNVLVTHHALSFQSVAPLYAGDMLNFAFASHNEELVRQFDLHIHGHMHNSCDYKIGDARVVCNPRGYYPHDLNQKYDPKMVIEI